MTIRRRVRSPAKKGDGVGCRLDLHGYTRAEAAGLADELVRRAWEAGCGSVTLIHGAPDVATREQAEAGGRGGIKYDLRDRQAGGVWSPYVLPPDAPDHALDPGVLTVKLKDNPAPSPARVEGWRCRQPTAARQIKARRTWGQTAREVEADYPVLAAAVQWPGAVRRCRRALTEERVLAVRLEHKRRNPDYGTSKPYRRLKKKWIKARAEADDALAAVEALVAGAAVGPGVQEQPFPDLTAPARPVVTHRGPADYTPMYQGDQA